MSICEIAEDSWQAIYNVQAEAYPNDFLENINVLKSKWKASSKTCFVFKSNNNEILGYILAHPWGSHKPPQLFEEMPEKSTGDILYLHDLAVSRRARDMGVGNKLSQQIIKIGKSQGFKSIMLVAVQGAENYWFKHGFVEISNDFNSISYGKAPKLMILNLPS